MYDALSELGNLSQQLQAHSVTLLRAEKLLKRTIRVLASFKDSPGEKLEEALAAQTLGHLGSVPLESNGKLTRINPKQFLQSLINNLEKRLSFEGEMLHDLSVLDTGNWPSSPGIRHGEAQVKRLCRRFNLGEEQAVNGMRDFLEHPDSEPENLKPLMQCMQTIPCSTAECERGFSLMNNICTDKRSTLLLSNVLYGRDKFRRHHWGFFDDDNDDDDDDDEDDDYDDDDDDDDDHHFNAAEGLWNYGLWSRVTTAVIDSWTRVEVISEDVSPTRLRLTFSPPKHSRAIDACSREDIQYVQMWREGGKQRGKERGSRGGEKREGKERREGGETEERPRGETEERRGREKEIERRGGEREERRDGGEKERERRGGEREERRRGETEERRGGEKEIERRGGEREERRRGETEERRGGEKEIERRGGERECPKGERGEKMAGVQSGRVGGMWESGIDAGKHLYNVRGGVGSGTAKDPHPLCLRLRVGLTGTKNAITEACFAAWERAAMVVTSRGGRGGKGLPAYLFAAVFLACHDKEADTGLYEGKETKINKKYAMKRFLLMWNRRSQERAGGVGLPGKEMRGRESEVRKAEEGKGEEGREEAGLQWSGSRPGLLSDTHALLASEEEEEEEEGMGGTEKGERRRRKRGEEMEEEDKGRRRERGEEEVDRTCGDVEGRGLEAGGPGVRREGYLEVLSDMGESFSGVC
ncbi:E3 SUMO-protein ligase KIAA1586 [Merluccius polli]|uniref:E3 SUMO-protein ligase KIAA1586 n=1 Tax=Merluccius polli TaxID=89951 RepID=A0AA47M4P1_MERPO|nr:E3 SUMO-protein ligase KIAA1586 [Merluccius polli]